MKATNIPTPTITLQLMRPLARPTTVACAQFARDMPSTVVCGSQISRSLRAAGHESPTLRKNLGFGAEDSVPGVASMQGVGAARLQDAGRPPFEGDPDRA